MIARTSQWWESDPARCPDCRELHDRDRTDHPRNPDIVRVVNLTPHPLTVGGHSIAPDGRLPRVAEDLGPIRWLVRYGGGAEYATGEYRWKQPYNDGAPAVMIPVQQVALGAVTGLPDPEPHTYYVVSRMVADATPGRRDLLVPIGQVRDETGRVVGSTALGQVPAPA